MLKLVDLVVPRGHGGRLFHIEIAYRLDGAAHGFVREAAHFGEHVPQMRQFLSK